MAPAVSHHVESSLVAGQPSHVIRLFAIAMSSTDAVPETDASAASMLGTEPLACVSCRARKLKCDRTKPACTRCVKVKNDCVYPESRRKPTFKRRNVKELEARLGTLPSIHLHPPPVNVCHRAQAYLASCIAQVEEYLKEVNKGNDDGAVLLDDADISLGDFSFPGDNISQDANTSSSTSDPNLSFDIPNFAGGNAFMNNQLMGLGMSEALPPFEVIEELYAWHRRPLSEKR